MKKLTHALEILLLRTGFNAIESHLGGIEGSVIKKSASQQPSQNARQIALDQYKLLRSKN